MSTPDDLNATLARLGNVLAREVEAWEQKTRVDRARVMEHVSKKIERALMSSTERRELRQRERAAAKAQRRARQLEQASVPGGVFLMAIAAVLVVFAFLSPEMWWLVFVALGVGSSGVRNLALATERSRAAPALTAPAENKAVQASSSHEIDTLCDQLLADLKASPEAVRAFVQRPEQTVESLRATAKALDVRRRQLAAEDAPGHLAALATQRATLASRRDATQDTLARGRLEVSLRSLDAQHGALQQLVVAAERVDGEYTSLLVLLQELRTRVAVARATTTAPQLGGLEQSVQRLNSELEAITESLQATTASPFTAVDEVGLGPSATPSAPSRVRE
jgi:hypothetical protein